MWERHWNLCKGCQLPYLFEHFRSWASTTGESSRHFFHKLVGFASSNIVEFKAMLQAAKSLDVLIFQQQRSKIDLWDKTWEKLIISLKKKSITIPWINCYVQLTLLRLLLNVLFFFLFPSDLRNLRIKDTGNVEKLTSCLLFSSCIADISGNLLYSFKCNVLIALCNVLRAEKYENSYRQCCTVF